MNLNRASTFVRVVESGGFTRAAEALGLPPSSISRSVAKLEDELGVQLLERTTRKISLTEAGRAYFERAREALAGLEEASSLARDAAQEIHGVVRVALPVGLGVEAGSVFAPLLADTPKLRIELTFTERGAELVGDLVDLAVVFGRLPDSSLVTRRLGEALQRLYAAPAYLDRRGTPRTLGDLAKHASILTRATAGAAQLELVGPRGAETVEVRGQIVGDGLEFAADAAAAGLGIALLPVWLGERGVREQRLAPVLPRYSIALPLHVLAHGARHLPRRVSLVRDFLVGHLGHRCTAHARLDEPRRKCRPA